MAVVSRATSYQAPVQGRTVRSRVKIRGRQITKNRDTKRTDPDVLRDLLEGRSENPREHVRLKTSFLTSFVRNDANGSLILAFMSSVSGQEEFKARIDKIIDRFEEKASNTAFTCG